MKRSVSILVVSAVAVGGCMTPVMTFGSGKSAKQAQHDTLESYFMPARLDMDGAWRGPIKDAKIRVYADDRYRAQNLTWRQTFDESLEYANAVLGPHFGVRLVADYREWSHHAPSNTLADDLEELRELDAGDDVLGVVGLTSSLSLVSATFDQLGYASVPGRHMMIRGYADLEERKAFAEAFPKLSAAERQNALVARRAHKTTTVLLHELAHNLGAPHDAGEDTITSAGYSERAAAFSADAHATIRRTLDERLGRTTGEQGPAPVAAAAPAKQHQRLSVLITANGVYIAGKARHAGELDGLFSTQASLDAQTEVVIETAGNVAPLVVSDVISRARENGLSKITTR